MNRPFYAGIDIGTHQVKVVIAAPADNPDAPMRMLGTGAAASKGMRHGYIIDRAETTRNIREALERAIGAAKIRVKSAYVAFGGIGLEEIHSTGDISLASAGGIVTEQLITRALHESEKRASPKLANRIILHTIPLAWRLDGESIVGKSPEGLQGTKLTVDTLLITALEQQHDELVEAVEAAGIEIEGNDGKLIAAPIAASLVTLTRAQKIAGVCLANIGAETLSLIVYDNDIPISLKVFPTGSSDITSSIALSFQIPLPEAEALKRGGVTGSEVPQRKMETIVTKKLKDMFTLINGHLKSIQRQGLLPAGIVLTGGGSGMNTAQEVARSVLKLPSSIGQFGPSRSTMVDATWAVAYGLCRLAYMADVDEGDQTVGDVMKGGFKALKRGLRSLLP